MHPSSARPAGATTGAFPVPSRPHRLDVISAIDAASHPPTVDTFNVALFNSISSSRIRGNPGQSMDNPTVPFRAFPRLPWSKSSTPNKAPQATTTPIRIPIQIRENPRQSVDKSPRLPPGPFPCRSAISVDAKYCAINDFGRRPRRKSAAQPFTHPKFLAASRNRTHQSSEYCKCKAQRITTARRSSRPPSPPVKPPDNQSGAPPLLPNQSHSLAHTPVATLSTRLAISSQEGKIDEKLNIRQLIATPRSRFTEFRKKVK